MENETLEKLEQASKAYYEGNPIMTDEAFDILSDLVKNPRVGYTCLLYTSPSPRDGLLSRMPSSA